MGTNLIALAVPFFFAGIGLELWVARRRGVKVYRWADAFSDLGCGISQQVSQGFYAAGLITVYAAAHAELSVIRFAEGSPWPWVIAFAGVEFAYYWWHRLSHEVNFLWAAHVVHHQSEDYNLAVALRQSVLTGFTVFPFYVCLAVVGVPALHFTVAVAVSTLYQFWIHTQLIGRLGFLERWLNTPALHRVHHAINPRYIDKNYGGIIIVFDRLFGTYEPETEPPVYGLVSGLKSFNPVWAQFHYLATLVRRSRRALGFGDAVRVWIRGPEWSLPGVETPHLPAPVSPETYEKFDVRPSPAVIAYVSAQFAVLVVATFALMMWGGAWSLLPLGLVGFCVFGSLPVLAGLLEGRGWARRAEPLRLALFAGATVALATITAPPLAGLPLVIAVISGIVLLRLPELRVASSTSPG